MLTVAGKWEDLAGLLEWQAHFQRRSYQMVEQAGVLVLASVEAAARGLDETVPWERMRNQGRAQRRE